jgi:hypothetical protein
MNFGHFGGKQNYCVVKFKNSLILSPKHRETERKGRNFKFKEKNPSASPNGCRQHREGKRTKPEKDARIWFVDLYS